MLLDIFHTIHSTCTGKESITPSGAFYRCALLYCACHLCRKVSPLHPSEKRHKNQSFVPIFLFRPADYHYGSVQTELILKEGGGGGEFDSPLTVLINSTP